MSYILEALQRADAERKRAQPPTMATVVDGARVSAPASSGRRGVLWGVVGTMAALLIWSLWPGRPAKVVVGGAPVSMAQRPPLPPKVQASPPAAPKEAAATVVKRVVPAVPAPTHPVKPVPAPQAAPARPKPPTAQKPVMWAQLPPAIRRQLPAMHISALIDHQDPARRVAWINDRALHVGAWISDAVRLVAITGSDVTVAFQGYRIVITPFDDHVGRRR